MTFVMPRQGEGWRHYKGGYQSLYIIVGVGPDHEGVPTVAYARWGDTSDQAPIFFQPLGRFLQHVEIDVSVYQQADHHVPRFRFEREAPGDGSRYIRQSEPLAI